MLFGCLRLSAIRLFIQRATATSAGFRIMTRSQGHNQIYTIRCDDTRKVNIYAYCVQRDDTSESWPTPPTDLRQRGRSVQKQQEQLFHCWSEGELGKGGRGSSTTTILAYNPMASCPLKLLPCSNSCICWSFTVRAYEIHYKWR
ncbi:uncharacterized protein [Triticum aestivum]|uniref:uncharacterized protein n=1 Tax=Triticum aestivum TaxID=4565 RepID=UPI001D026372|nr:uncharacterized protein LOC123089473 [Triticum aestivum]